MRLICSVVLLTAALLSLSSCVVPRGKVSPELSAANEQLRLANRTIHSRPLDSLGPYLSAAESAWKEVEKDPQDPAAREIYNGACEQVAKVLFDAGTDWSRQVQVDHDSGSYRIRTMRSGGDRVDPAFFDELHLASSIELPSDFNRYTTAGIGGMMAGRHVRRENDDPFVARPGMILPVTALLTFPRPGEVEFELIDNQLAGRVILDGRSYELSADHSAPVSVWLDHIPKENIGWNGMLRPEAYLANMGLYMVEPHRSGKIPVVMVHGLQSRPKIWANAYNELNADPLIRENFQFLYYQYPTGFPIAYNSAGLRHRLQEFQRTYDPKRSNPLMRQMILVGHSMGGILSNIQVREGGEAVRAKLFKPEMKESDLTPHEVKVIAELTDFKANRDVRRVIFVCAPHRGSQFASGTIGGIGIGLIDYSINALLGITEVKRSYLTEDAQRLLDRGATSIGDLEPNSPALTTILELDAHPGVSFHSIIGDRGRGDTPDSSDGVVPYWSSHLSYAATEAIVPYDHGAPRHQETIEQIRKVLHLHLQSN